VYDNFKAMSVLKYLDVNESHAFAAWCSNIGNEHGEEILNSVLTATEGAGLFNLCQGIVKRYG